MPSVLLRPAPAAPRRGRPVVRLAAAGAVSAVCALAACGDGEAAEAAHDAYAELVNEATDRTPDMTEIGAMSEAELDAFEALIEVPDRDLFRWLTGEIETPDNYDTSIYRRLKAFHRHDAPIHS